MLIYFYYFRQKLLLKARLTLDSHPQQFRQLIELGKILEVYQPVKYLNMIVFRYSSVLCRNQHFLQFSRHFLANKNFRLVVIWPIFATNMRSDTKSQIRLRQVISLEIIANPIKTSSRTFSNIKVRILEYTVKFKGLHFLYIEMQPLNIRTVSQNHCELIWNKINKINQI